MREQRKIAAATPRNDELKIATSLTALAMTALSINLAMTEYPPRK